MVYRINEGGNDLQVYVDDQNGQMLSDHLQNLPTVSTGIVGMAFMAGAPLVVVKQAEKITPLIEAKYDEIYEICEKGSKLLY